MENEPKAGKWLLSIAGVMKLILVVFRRGVCYVARNVDCREQVYVHVVSKPASIGYDWFNLF